MAMPAFWVLAGVVAAAGLPASSKPASLPGKGDVCAGFAASTPRCSPEICNIASGAQVQLDARTYYQDRVIALPARAVLVGAGINKTIIVNCGSPSTEMRGFILGNDSYIGNFTWQGHSPSRGEFSGAVQTPGCADTGPCNVSRCIPTGGDCAGVQNVTVEHIHVLPYDTGSDWWPLVNDAAWFPRTVAWGPDRATGSRNITVRGMISWGTWADGINFHGGHHNVLVEDCEISYSGDDPYGLWPDSVQATEDSANCQRNIVLRNNVGRWPRSGRSRDVRDCANTGNHKGGDWHCCFATYGGGAGVQFLNNHCEGAAGVVRFLAAYPWTVKNETRYCGSVAVAGNTYAAMPAQGRGCRTDKSSQGYCEKTVQDFCGGVEPNPPTPPGCVNFACDTCGGQTAPVPLRAITIGGQCNASEPSLPPRCTGRDHGVCFATPGIGGVCYNETAVDGTCAMRCVSATDLADLAERGTVCAGFSSVCTLF